MNETTSPLLIVEIAQGIAGPAVGRLFAAMGHTVVKVEPPTGDRLRRTLTDAADDAWAQTSFTHVNAGKLGIVADGGAADSERLAALLDRADVVIIDEDIALAERFDLIGDGRAQRRPRLVTVSVSNFGLDAEMPWPRPDSLLAESYGGMATMIGDADGSPLSLGGEQAEYAAAFAAFFGAMASLLVVRAGGQGDVVDVALSDVVAYMDWKTDVAYSVTGAEQRRVGAQAGRWRILPARDGWAGIVYQPDQWHKVVQLVDDARLADPDLAEESVRDERSAEWWPIIEDWAASRTQLEIYESAQSIGLAFGMSVDMNGVIRSEQNRARGFVRTSEDEHLLGALFQSRELGWQTGPAPALGGDVRAVDELLAVPASTAAALSDTAGAPLRAALDGIKVLDLGTITAGAATGRLFADLGAQVVKVESPSRPDAFRYWTFPGENSEGAESGNSPVFTSNNAGKLGIALDLKVASEREALLELVRDADVLIENFSVGVTHRLGIDPETLHRINPDLVYLSLSSQGQSGPESGNRSYGSTLDLLSGLASITGYPDGPPSWSSVDVNYPDQLVSLLGAGVVCAALLRGGGAVIDVSQREAVTWTLAGYVGSSVVTGAAPAPRGNDRPGYLVHEIIACSDPDDSRRWIAVSVVDEAELTRLEECVGGISTERVADRLAEWASQLTRDQALAALRVADVPSVPVLAAAERSRAEHFRRRRVFLDEPRQKGFPFVLGTHPLPRPTSAPELGEHNALLREMSGMGTGDRLTR